MTDILYTQKDGFTDYEPPERLRWADGEAWDKYQEKLGLQSEWDQHAGPLQDYPGRHSWTFEYTPGAAKCSFVSTATGDEPRYRLEVYAVGTSDSEWEIVWVKTKGDLLALRIQLAQLLQVENNAILMDLRVLAKRTFEKYHEHSPDEVCSDCDYSENKRRGEEEAKRRAEQEELEAKERILFIFNRAEARVSIWHAKTPEAATASFENLLGRKPGLILALCEQGTARRGKTLIERFAKFVIASKQNNLFAASPEILAYINEHRAREKQEPVTLLEPEHAN